MTSGRERTSSGHVIGKTGVSVFLLGNTGGQVERTTFSDTLSERERTSAPSTRNAPVIIGRIWRTTCPDKQPSTERTDNPPL